jgi:hypothetical protein
MNGGREVRAAEVRAAEVRAAEVRAARAREHATREWHRRHKPSASSRHGSMRGEPTAGLISYRRGKIQIVDRAGLEKASCECYAIVKERFDAFLTPPSTAVQGDTGQRKR